MKDQTLQDLLQDCPCDHAQWCFLREIVRHTGISDMAAEQMRLVYTHKFIMSMKAGHDVGEQVACNSWISSGLAVKFREIYKEGMHHEELKYQMFMEGRNGAR